MKKFLLFGLLAFVLIPFNSCKKYEEGPALTLLSKKQRAANTWNIAKYYENGMDKTEDSKVVFTDFVLIMDKNNMKYSKSFKALGLLPYGESGSWKFSADQTSLEFTPDNTSIANYSWKIIKLKETELGVTYSYNNITVKAYFN